MELSPSWEAASCSTTQNFPKTLWNPKVHYRVHKRPLLLPMLSNMNQVHITSSYFSKVHVNIIYHLRLGIPSLLHVFIRPKYLGRTHIIINCFCIISRFLLLVYLDKTAGNFKNLKNINLKISTVLLKHTFKSQFFRITGFLDLVHCPAF
jgi:hypothetical protein